MSELKGSCLCGSVHYSIAAEPLLTGLCHCTHCQKLTGSAFSLNLAVPRDSVTVEGERLMHFDDVGDSGLPVRRYFCGRCGASIMSESDAIPDVRFIKAGTLEDPSWLNPTLEIWCETAQPWTRIEAARQFIERAPPLAPGAAPPHVEA
jgi:hypothetical protein